MAVADLLSGPILLYKAPVAEATPDTLIAAGAAWAGNWVNWGYTMAPLTAAYTFEELDYKVEQELTPVERVKTSEALTLETVLAEITAAKLAVATSGTATSTAAAAGVEAHDELTVGGENVLDKYQWGFEGTYVDASGTRWPVRMYVWKGTQSILSAQEYSTTSMVGIPIQIKALVDTTKSVGQKLFKWERVTAAAV